MDMVRHMKYLRNVGGIDIIGLGTDFDGFSGETDVPDTAHMQHLADVMSHEGFTDEEIEKNLQERADRTKKPLEEIKASANISAMRRNEAIRRAADWVIEHSTIEEK